MAAITHKNGQLNAAYRGLLGFSTRIQELVTFRPDEGIISPSRVVRGSRNQFPESSGSEHHSPNSFGLQEISMLNELMRRLWCEEEGQDIAEYAVMLAVILVIVVGLSA